LGLLPTKEQFSWLKSLFTNAKIHTVFDGRISGCVADCKVATLQIVKSARFSLVDEHGEFYCNKKRYRIPIGNFSLNRFERLSGIRAGIRTHKPKAPFETFYQSFTNGLILTSPPAPLIINWVRGFCRVPVSEKENKHPLIYHLITSL